MTEFTNSFAHRHKLDGSYDSICKDCVRTIANSRDELDLDKPEQEHVCQGLNLDSIFYDRTKDLNLSKP